jgi:hypothetical protein
MLQNQYFDLGVGPILWARQAHFYTFLLGVVLLGDFAFHNLHVEDGYERKNVATNHQDVPAHRALQSPGEPGRARDQVNTGGGSGDNH